MRTLLLRLLAAAVPVIAVLVAAAFVLPADFPWLPRQLLLAAIGIGGIALAEVAMFRTPPTELGRQLGFVTPNRRAVLVALAASLPMWLFLPVAALATGAPLHVAPDWLAVVLGVILVNGLAEEVIHRAFFFGRLRAQASFLTGGQSGRRAVRGAACLPHRDDRAGRGCLRRPGRSSSPIRCAGPSRWAAGRSSAPAILHTSSNAAFLVFGDASNSGLLMLHMLVVLISIYTVFLVRKPTTPPARPAAAFAEPELEM